MIFNFLSRVFDRSDHNRLTILYDRQYDLEKKAQKLACKIIKTNDEIATIRNRIIKAAKKVNELKKAPK